MIGGTVEYWFNQWAFVTAMLFFVSMIAVLFVALAFETRRLLDRYRLKYSFDKELERKEPYKKDAVTEEQQKNRDRQLNRREQAFKRRTFKD